MLSASRFARRRGRCFLRAWLGIMNHWAQYVDAGYEVRVYSPDCNSARSTWLTSSSSRMPVGGIEMNAGVAVRWPGTLVISGKLDLVTALENLSDERFSHLILGASDMCHALLTVPHGYAVSGVQHRLVPLKFTRPDLDEKLLFVPPTFEKNAGLRRYERRDDPNGLPSDVSPSLAELLVEKFALSKRWG